MSRHESPAMKRAKPAQPVRWPALAERHARDVAMKLQVYAQSGAKLGVFAANDLLSAYAGAQGVVARGSMLLGTDATRTVISLYHAALGRALRALDTAG